MSDTYDTIILHVGLHKTGSTSIQNQCQFQHGQLLRDNGIEYASFRWENKWRPNHGGPVTAALFDNPDRYNSEWRVGFRRPPEDAQRAFREQFEKILREPESPTLLLSGETFSTYNEEDLTLLRDRLQARCRQLRVLVYLRNPMQYFESVLQQRIRGGRRGNPESLQAVMRFRYHRLRRVFGEALELLNFDQHAAGPNGLLGSFLATCGVPEELLTDLESPVSNPRVSLEGFRIMLAINKRYPLKNDGVPSPVRTPRDLAPLNALPGARFTLYEYRDTPIYRVALEERDWFEEKLGIHFSGEEPQAPVGEWGYDTLTLLEDQVRQLEDRRLRVAAAEYLQEEADRVADTLPQSAPVLRFIARNLLEERASPPSRPLRSIGWEYFRAGAQQVRRHSPELALELMRVALEIKPDGRDIAERIAQWEKDALEEIEAGQSAMLPEGDGAEAGEPEIREPRT